MGRRYGSLTRFIIYIPNLMEMRNRDWRTLHLTISLQVPRFLRRYEKDRGGTMEFSRTISGPSILNSTCGGFIISSLTFSTSHKKSSLIPPALGFNQRNVSSTNTFHSLHLYYTNHYNGMDQRKSHQTLKMRLWQKIVLAGWFLVNDGRIERRLFQRRCQKKMRKANGQNEG